MSSKIRNSRRHFIGSCIAVSALPLTRVWAAVSCPPAVTNILGPAYRKGAPFRTRLCARDEPGSPLTMTGTVTDADTCKALAGAVLDVWQVNARGDYDMDSADFRLRGRMKAHTDGRYTFDTVLPVPYGNRPKHIHYLVTRDGYEPRITQCYFAGDERNATDPYVKKELIIAPQSGPDHSRQSDAFMGVFDVALERERAVTAASAKQYADFVGDYQIAEGVVVTISAAGNRLHWHLTAGEDPGDALDGELLPRAHSRFFVAEYDMEINFVRDEHGEVTHTLNNRGELSKKIR